MKNRQKAEQYILKYIDKIIPNSENKTIYANFFNSLNDKQFDEYMNKLESGEYILSIFSPNFSKNSISIENNLKLAEELGHRFFQKLWIESNTDLPTYQTPNEYLIIDIPVRRASQSVIKKILVPDDNKTIDAMTGQPTGESKGAKISYPEVQILASMGMDNSLIELMKYRGGDNKGHIAFNGMVSKYGNVNLQSLSQFASGVESTKTFKTFLTCMHLKSTL